MTTTVKPFDERQTAAQQPLAADSARDRGALRLMRDVRRQTEIAVASIRRAFVLPAL
jgi:hypothetical protein